MSTKRERRTCANCGHCRKRNQKAKPEPSDKQSATPSQPAIDQATSDQASAAKDYTDGDSQSV